MCRDEAECGVGWGGGRMNKLLKSSALEGGKAEESSVTLDGREITAVRKELISACSIYSVFWVFVGSKKKS